LWFTNKKINQSINDDAADADAAADEA